MPDRGGISYGAYQLASSNDGGRQVQAFLNSAEGARWAKDLEGLDPTEPGAFGKKWKEIAAREPDAFLDAQDAFFDRTHVQPVLNYVKEITGLDISSRSTGLQAAVWSTADQHGKARFLLLEAVHKLPKGLPSSNPSYDRALINAIYDVRTLHHPSYARRYDRERRDALAMLDGK